MNIKCKMISSLEEQLTIKVKVEERVKELERQIAEVIFRIVILSCDAFDLLSSFLLQYYDVYFILVE